MLRLIFIRHVYNKIVFQLRGLQADVAFYFWKYYSVNKHGSLNKHGSNKCEQNFLVFPTSVKLANWMKKQQLTTLDWDVGSKLTNQKLVVFPERSSSWVEKQLARSKIHKMAGPLKIKGRDSSMNSWIFSYPEFCTEMCSSVHKLCRIYIKVR